MLVSIIITNYNYGKYLHRCIRSCLNQTLPTNQFEVILVDDFSNDGSDKIANEYKTVPNFKVIRNKKNLGVSKSSNNAIKVAKGRYVVRVDSDDFVTNEFINILSYYLKEKPSYLGASSDYYLVNDDGKKLSKISSKLKPVSCGILYNKKKLLKAGLYNPKFKHREEEELRYRLDKEYKIFHTNLALYRYRMHRSNKTKSNDYINIFKDKINNLRKSKLIKEYGNKKILKNISVIIPARGNSKRLKNKNIYPFKGMPMVYWAIKAAEESAFINNVYVTSDSSKILNLTKKMGATPIQRPKVLSGDNVFKIEAIKHANDIIEKKSKKKSTLIISLQANSPEVTSENIDEGIIHLIKHKRQEVISLDRKNNSNAAIRIMKRNALYQKSLSTYLGCIHVNATDIHTIKDIKKIYKDNEN